MHYLRPAALAFTLLGASLQAQTPGVHAPEFGAYVQVPVNSPQVKEARDFVQSRLTTFSLGETARAYVQVVAGLNVKLICDVNEEGKTVSWGFSAFRSLDGQWHLMLAERI
jgi:hypothetical protein